MPKRKKRSKQAGKAAALAKLKAKADKKAGVVRGKKK